MENDAIYTPCKELLLMLEPHYLQQIADRSEQIASELHEYIIQQIVDRMMIRIGRGDSYLLTSSDRWRIEVLQDRCV